MQLCDQQNGMSRSNSDFYVQMAWGGLYETDAFEIRVAYQSNIYRIFCCFDEGQLVILFNGFQKKSQKTPKKEIDKAIKLKNEYFQSKNNRP
ncbi:MAG: type II toxin-antitoxin system RelE/ParE family toxin [Reichenbachiella sp.]